MEPIWRLVFKKPTDVLLYGSHPFTEELFDRALTRHLFF